jgi:hypothetical protein
MLLTDKQTKVLIYLFEKTNGVWIERVWTSPTELGQNVGREASLDRKFLGIVRG